MKTKTAKATLALLCAAALLLQSSCSLITFGDGKATEDTPISTADKPKDTANDNAETAPDITDDKDIEKQLTGAELARERLRALPDRDLGGASVIVATTDPSTVCPDATGSPVVSVRADVKAAVEEKYNCKIITRVADSETLFGEIRDAYKSDLYYADLIAIPQSDVGKYVSEGLLANLRSLPFANLDAEYYNSSISKAATAGDAVYAVGGSASLNPEYLTGVYFNKDLMAECGVDDIYELVYSGEWTWDKLYELSEAAAALGDDKYGHGTSMSRETFTDIAAHSMGIDYVSNELHTAPTVDYMISELADTYSTSVDKLADHMYGERTFKDTDAIPMFTDGNLLFYTDRLYFMQWIFDIDFNWGLLPLPKLDSDQERYLSLSSEDSPVFCVIKNTPDYALSALILEALNCAAYGYTEGAYLERCMNSYLRSNDSARCLKIIYSTQSVDFAHLFASGYKYLANATYTAFHKAVTTNSTLNAQFRSYRGYANYWIGFLKPYGG